jgi:hypothetical protein
MRSCNSGCKGRPSANNQRQRARNPAASKAPLAWKRQKVPADAAVFKDKIWLHTYTNKSRIKPTKVSIVDLHAEQQAGQATAG